jgi:hypothetical protein
VSRERGTSASYSYRFHSDQLLEKDRQSELALAQDMKYIADTIANLTGGCEICKNQIGLFCQVHHRPVHAGDTRCDDFARRFPEDPEHAAKAQAQAYVNQTLGLSKRNLRRMTDAK